MRKIYFVTRNEYKFKRFLDSTQVDNIEFERLAEETLEIQAYDNQVVSSFSAKWVADKMGLSVIKEDVGLYIRALNGFPGPYLNQIEKWIEAEGFVNLMRSKQDRFAYWEYSVSYCEPGKNPVTFFTHQEGSIALEVRGNGGWFADKIFIPTGIKKTIAELLDNNAYVRNESHYKQLGEYLSDL